MEVLVASILIGVTGIGTGLAIQTVHHRLEINRARQALRQAAEAEIANLEQMSLLGLLTGTINQVTSLNLSGAVSGTLTTVTSPVSILTGHTVARVTASATVRGVTITIPYETGFNVTQRPMAVGVIFQSAPASDLVPLYLGLHPTPNWAPAPNGAITNARNANGVSTTLDVTSSINTISTLSNHLDVSGADQAGANMRRLFQSALRPSPPSTTEFTITVSQIPYSRYDLIVYCNLQDSTVTAQGQIELSQGSQFAVTTPDANGNGRRDFVSGQNFVMISNLGSSTITLTLRGANGAPPVHGIQVIQRL